MAWCAAGSQRGRIERSPAPVGTVERWEAGSLGQAPRNPRTAGSSSRFWHQIELAGSRTGRNRRRSLVGGGDLLNWRNSTRGACPPSPVTRIAIADDAEGKL